MKIYIPSRGRADIHTTFRMLTHWAEPMLVVPVNEMKYYHQWGVNSLLGVDPKVKGIAHTRQWIMDHHWRTYGMREPVLVMMDDDLSFAKRRVDDPTKFMNISAKGSEAMLKDLEKLLLKHAHGGILGREGGNRITERVVYNHRTCRVIGFNVPMVRAAMKGSRLFGDVPVQDDFHATLTLLRKGLKNAVLCSYVNNQRGSGTEGGASVYRTMAVHNDSVETLRLRHPAFVRVVEKQTKVAWGGQARNDVIVAWKKAYEEGLQWQASLKGNK